MTLKTKNGCNVVATKQMRPVPRRSLLEIRTAKRRSVVAKVSSPSSIQESLDALSLPQIKSWNVESGIDASGENALWAWGTVVSNKVDPEELARIREIVRAEVAKTAKENAPWVYVRFRDAVRM